MKKTVLSIFCLVGMLSCTNNAEHNIDDVNNQNENDTICFVTATKSEAQILLGKEDAYTRNLSKFDLTSCPGNESKTKEEFIRLTVNEAQEWNENEKELIRKCMLAVNDSIRKYDYNLPLPKEIKIVKSPLTTAGGASGYTRSEWIALNMDKLVNADFKTIQEILVHETFHVLTRNNKDFRKKMYETIGFSINEEELNYPEDMDSLRISNPDVERFDSYATFLVDGKEQKCAMTIYSDKPYNGASFFQYMKAGFIALDDNLEPLKKDGKTIVYTIDDLDNFWEKVGKNTFYTIDPEEIMAENFRYAFLRNPNMQSPEIIEKVKNIICDSDNN